MNGYPPPAYYSTLNKYNQLTSFVIESVLTIYQSLIPYGNVFSAYPTKGHA